MSLHERDEHRHGEWKLWREGEPLSQRFTATLTDDGTTITGRWVIAEDGTNYTTDFDLIYRRAETWRRLRAIRDGVRDER